MMHSIGNGEGRIRTFAVSTCAYKKNTFGVSEVAHRASLVHTLDNETAEKFAQYLLKTNYPTSEGWIHVGYNIATPDSLMQFPDVTGNTRN